MAEDDFTIWEAGRATSAATSFFDPVKVVRGRSVREYVDGAFGFNNPLDQVWAEAQDIWSPDQGKLEPMIKCVVSIGTGNPGLSAIEDKPWSIFETLKQIATQTEDTEQRFAMHHRDLIDGGQRYYRFNVPHGLEKVELEEYERQGEIMDATMAYLNNHQPVIFQFRDCAQNLSHKKCTLVEDFS
jgi:hypothetical protein